MDPLLAPFCGCARRGRPSVSSGSREAERHSRALGTPLQLQEAPKQVRPHPRGCTLEAGEDGAVAGGFRAGVCSWLLWGSRGGGLHSQAFGHWGQVDGSAVSLQEHGRAGRCLASSVPGCLVPAHAGGSPGDGVNHLTSSNTPPSASREGLVS